MTWNTHHSRKTSKKRSRATEQFTAPPMNWRWVQKHSHTVHGTSIYQKDFSLTPIDYKSTDLEYTSQQKDLKKAVKGHRTVHSTTNELEVGSKKNSHTVNGTSISKKAFGLTPIAYKPTDLEYTSQQKDLKKAVKGHRTVHSTTNELE